MIFNKGTHKSTVIQLGRREFYFHRGHLAMLETFLEVTIEGILLMPDWQMPVIRKISYNAQDWARWLSQLRWLLPCMTNLRWIPRIHIAEGEKSLVGYSLTSTWVPQNMHQATQEVNSVIKKILKANNCSPKFGIIAHVYYMSQYWKGRGGKTPRGKHGLHSESKEKQIKLNKQKPISTRTTETASKNQSFQD